MVPVLILPSLGPHPTLRFVGVESRGWIESNEYRVRRKACKDFVWVEWVSISNDDGGLLHYLSFQYVSILVSTCRACQMIVMIVMIVIS